MAQSTTVISGCDWSIWLDDSTGTAREISGSMNSVTMNFDQSIGEYVAFGGKWPNRLECGKDASFDLVILYSLTANEGADVLIDWFFATTPGDRTLSIYVPDKNVGSDYFYCEAKLEHLDTSGVPRTAEPVLLNARLLPNGEVTHTVAST